ncbi:receptor protein-tyrosine kinase CEPR2-like [Primulina eburnea]|uniref:receptor protein-tyrosine kinase CEPR2-like n=1 Tax=Primulina eburnea TaxID=1245227 RepID=UPI003C6C1ED6
MATQLNPYLSLQILTIFLSFFHHSMCITIEKQALLKFKSQLIDPLNYLDSWKDSDSDSGSPCKFYGITCDQETGFVTDISLDNKSLSGVISPSLSILQSLTSLVLPSNLLSGIIPSEFRNLTNLKVLNLTGNIMNGTIPDLSNLIKLERLDLSGNYFSGAFPAWVGNLSGLVSLGLGDNDYDEGEIPESLGNLKKLYWLYLASSNLRGAIPDSIFELEALGTLDICKNKISGNFPNSIYKLKNLFKIELYGNNLTGEIPAGLANLTLLQEFDISDNQMHGTVPHEIGLLRKLTVFHLFKNNFSGEIPVGFGDMQHLFALSLYKNSFSGEFPQNLGRISPLNSIDISENKFSGAFPRYLCQNGNLQNLLALDNDFSGEFPDSYARCNPLQRLRVNQNRLNGTIPDGIWSLPNVQVMDFSDNYVTGWISPGIGDSKNLNELMLSNNRFSGEIPKELGQLMLLERVILNGNKLSGKIPSELGALEQINSLQLEENELIGTIPSELANCPRLVNLNLAWNFLSGEIPDSLSNMLSLNSLNLSRNLLIGPIPRNLDKLKLSSIDLSNNQLSGTVPSDLLAVAGDIAFLGNKGLCIDEEKSTGQLINTDLGLCHVKRGHKNFIKSKLVMLCIILFALAIILVGLLLVSYRSFKQNEFDMDNRVDVEKEKRSNWKLESFQQVEFDVDEICSVDEDNLIGTGSSGKVYRLDLKKGFGTVAVKQIWKGNGVKLMAAEMEILGKIRHRNILKLLACLTKEGSNFLVFEYMENGNLFEALHKEIKVGKPELDWFKRYRIALGAAKGIAYLHHDYSPPIIHRDIKSTNILLDEDYEAKIADFGVAKLAEQVSPKGSNVSCFAGTHGYIAPEMAYSHKATEKIDIYSYGVVLLELVTGKRPIEEEYGEGKDIVYWVSAHLNNRENVLKILDSKVVVTELVQDDMIKVLKIAILCTAKLPNPRPNMKEVVKMLIDAEPCTLRSPDSFEKYDDKPFLSG